MSTEYPQPPAQPQPAQGYAPQGQTPPQQAAPYAATGPIPTPYAAQPGGYPTGYVAQPSPFMQPANWAQKLPMVALVALVAGVVGGVVHLIYVIASASEYADGVDIAYSAIWGLIDYAVFGFVAFALIMAFSHLISLVAGLKAKD
jgi:hypothetical protein